MESHNNKHFYYPIEVAYSTYLMLHVGYLIKLLRGIPKNCLKSKPILG